MAVAIRDGLIKAAQTLSPTPDAFQYATHCKTREDHGTLLDASIPILIEIDEDQRCVQSRAGVGRAFGPHDHSFAAHSWGVAPGWYGSDRWSSSITINRGIVVVIGHAPFSSFGCVLTGKRSLIRCAHNDDVADAKWAPHARPARMGYTYTDSRTSRSVATEGSGV